jgi:hypothetical protein
LPTATPQRRFVGPIAALFGLALLCGAAPAPEGNETTIGVGMGTYEYRSGGCGGTRRSYSVTEPIAQLQVRHRTENDRLIVGEANLAVGMLGDSREDPNEVDVEEDLLDAGQAFWTGMAAARFGRQWKYVGYELGPGVAYHHRFEGWKPVPSGGLWAGKPNVAYVWADVFRGPFGGAVEFSAMAGVGHESRFLSAQLGSNIRAHMATIDLRVGQGARLGFLAGYGESWADQSTPDLRGMVRLTIDYRAFSRPDTP